MLQPIEGRPVVAFNLDATLGVVQEPESLPYTPTLQAIDNVRRLGGSCVLLTRAEALPDGDLANQIDAAYCGMRGWHHKAKTLGEVAAWAYVGNQMEDMRSGRMAGVKTFGITRDESSAKKLWTSGAEIILGGIEEFPGYFRFGNDTMELLTAVSFAKMTLQPDPTGIHRWMKDGSIPFYEDAFGDKRYPTKFAERVLCYTNGKRPSKKDAEFCYLEWLARHGSRAEHKEVLRKVDELVAEGQICTTQQVAEAVGYDKHIVANWHRYDFLPGIIVGNNLYFRASQAKTTIEIMNGLTLYEVMADLGRAHNTLSYAIRTGKLKAFLTPHGYRVLPRDLKRYKEARDNGEYSWSLADVVEVLGIPRATLKKWCDMGLIPFIKVNTTLRAFKPADVQAVKEKLHTLNPEFRWLNATKHTAYSMQQVARELGLTKETIAAWRTILPWFPLTPVDDSRYVVYPKAYIDALRTYAGEIPVSKKKAIEFMHLMRVVSESEESS